MNKTEIYNSDYTKLNHSYIEIYNTYQKLSLADDADSEVMDVLGKILIVFNPVLDKIKSEMTVKTRFKETENANLAKNSGFNSDEDENISKKRKGKGPIILRGNFTGE